MNSDHYIVHYCVVDILTQTAGIDDDNNYEYTYVAPISNSGTTESTFTSFSEEGM